MVNRAAYAADESGGERFQDLVLRHRGRTGLTQRELAARLGVHVRSIQAWEGGVSYPDAAHLQALLAVYLRASGLTAGQEVAQAREVWAAAVQEAPRLRTPFDHDWFAALLAAAAAPADLVAPATLATSVGGERRQDWGEAPDVVGFRGRAPERALLTRWLRDERCRLVALLGLGGIGKTILAARLARDLAPAFERVYWRSLRNGPAPDEWLAGAIGFLMPEQVPPEGEAARLTLLLRLLRAQRCLLAVDNFETVLQPAEREGRYREGYADYGTLL